MEHKEINQEHWNVGTSLRSLLSRFRFPTNKESSDSKIFETDMYLEFVQFHYLKNVMRVETGTEIKIFDGRSGEWWCRLNAGSTKTGCAGK
jgi:hypothetical protein